MSAPLLTRRFTVDEYHRMAEAGILTEDDRVELLDGEIVEMSPIGSRHAGTVARLTRLFGERAGDRAIVWPQNPIRLSRFLEPEPDVCLLRPRDDFYTSAHPDREHILLLVEVADTSLHFDRTHKIPLYARGAIPEVWLVDLEGQAIDVYREPRREGYREVRTAGLGDTVSALALPALIVRVDEILAPVP